MSGVLIVSGTDTDIGKTVVAAGLAAALGAFYWKPVQAGTADGTDSARAAALGVPEDCVLPEAYRLALPASPHLAARAEGVALDPARLALPPQRPLVVEGAGGLLVPLRRDPPRLVIDQIAEWTAPVLLVARTALGTINHSLLSLEALRTRGIPVAGILFSGHDEPETISTIADLGQAPVLGRLPLLDPLDPASLGDAIRQHVDLDAIRKTMILSS